MMDEQIGTDDGDRVPQQRGTSREAKALEHACVERTLKGLDDDGRRHDDDKDVHDALDRLGSEHLHLPTDEADRHQREQHAHLRRHENEVIH